MRTVDARTGIEVIEREECLRLLASRRIGRIAVVDGYSPVIFPVNYLIDDADVVFRAAEGTKLTAVGRANACFEIDDYDAERRSGWSILAIGRLEELAPSDRAYARLSALPVDPWADGEHPHILRLVGTRVTGRRIGGGAT